MEVDIIYDTVCPWCFIGKRRFEEALALRPEIKIKPNWKPFLLNPGMPLDGIDRSAYLIKKFGSEARIRRIYGAISDAGLSVEINFGFDLIGRAPNSVNSHRLVRFADTFAKATQAVEAVFVEHFIKGRDIGRRDVLCDIAEQLELDIDKLNVLLDSDDDIHAILSENTKVHSLGINGVPAYLFNGKMAISGAQDAEVLARMLDVASLTQAA